VDEDAPAMARAANVPAPIDSHFTRPSVRTRCEGAVSVRVGSTIVLMAEAGSLDERLEHIGTQLDWVRDYL